MLRPWPHTHPAKLIITPSSFLSTRHMIASLILLYWLPALRTLFRVRENPSHVFAFCGIFEDPFSHDIACARTMALFGAGEAVYVATVTGDFLHP